MEKLTERYDAKRGINKKEMYEALTELEIPVKLKRFNSLNYGSAYIMMVASLNGAGRMHWIVVDLRKWQLDVYDPNKGRPGKKFYNDFDSLYGWGDLMQVVPKRRLTIEEGAIK